MTGFVSANVASVIASAIFCHREARSNLVCLSPRALFSAIARHEAISYVCHREERDDLGLLGWQTEKREIASQARLYLSSRGTKRSRFFTAGKQTKERLLCRLALVCHRERSVAISVFYRLRTEKREIASQARNDRIVLSSRGTWRSRLSGAGGQRKERLPRYARNDKKYNREGRSDLGCSGMANREKRDCHATLAMTRQRHEAISPFQGWRTEKREIATLRSQ